MNEQIVEILYDEAVSLAEDIRAVLALGFEKSGGRESDEMRIALSIEGMRSTTRIMNVMAWLLNQRAYFAGELSARQLHRRNKLDEDRPSDGIYFDMLEPATRSLIKETERLHARVSRLDSDWRSEPGNTPGPIGDMQARIATAFEG